MYYFEEFYDSKAEKWFYHTIAEHKLEWSSAHKNSDKNIDFITNGLIQRNIADAVLMNEQSNAQAMYHAQKRSKNFWKER
jgi:hypothetical protein